MIKTPVKTRKSLNDWDIIDSRNLCVISGIFLKEEADQIVEALNAQQPCKTCGGSGKRPLCIAGSGVQSIPCPDCQSATEKSGCVCQQCGKVYDIDLNIPDYWWEKIKPKDKPIEGGLLCPTCIIQDLKAYKEIVCLYLKIDTGQQPATQTGELHIEDADIIADLSGGKLAIQKFRERIAELQKKKEQAAARIEELEKDKARLTDWLQTIRIHTDDADAMGWANSALEGKERKTELIEESE